jgi:hypothetical protein
VAVLDERRNFSLILLAESALAAELLDSVRPLDH